MNQNYEKIKRACQIANPKLMELSLGCELVISTSDGNRNVTIGLEGSGSYVKRNQFYEPWYGDGSYGSGENSYEVVEILGHQPSLQDILLAMKRKNLPALYFIDYMGTWWYDTEERNRPALYKGDLAPAYDLTKPVKDQSEECLKFLADLL